MSLPPPHVTNVCTRDLQAIAARPRSDPKRAQRCNPNRHACPAASCRGLPTGALVSQQLFRSPKDMENLICCGPHKFPKFPKIDSFLVFKTRLGFQCVHIDRWIRALASTNFGQEYRPSTWEITFILKVIFILVPNKLGETKGQCRTEHIGKPRKGTLVGPSFTHPQKINGLCFARCEHHMGCHNMVSTQIACNVSRYTSIVQPYSFFPTTGLWIMGKGSEFARKSRSRMPYSADSGEKKVPTSWKMKQRSYTMAGLRRLRAPWVPRLSQSSAPNVEWDIGFQNAGIPVSGYWTKTVFVIYIYYHIVLDSVPCMPSCLDSRHSTTWKYQEHSNCLVGLDLHKESYNLPSLDPFKNEHKIGKLVIFLLVCHPKNRPPQPTNV